MPQPRMQVKPPICYALLQILGWASVLLVLLLLLQWGWINTTAAGVVIVLWLAKLKFQHHARSKSMNRLA